MLTQKHLAQMIDHTLLKAETSQAEVAQLCQEANKHSFYSVCLPSAHIPQAKSLISPPVKIITVVGFPLGHSHTMAKLAETKAALDLGADEIDMVIQLGALLEGDYKTVAGDIEAIAKACALFNAPLKVILETATLNEDQIHKACQISLDSGAQFVKTSTGFHKAGGAQVAHIRAMKAVVGTKMGIKASGGIRTFQQARAMVDAGATRIGTSSSVAMVTVDSDKLAMVSTTQGGHKANDDGEKNGSY